MARYPAFAHKLSRLCVVELLPLSSFLRSAGVKVTAFVPGS